MSLLTTPLFSSLLFETPIAMMPEYQYFQLQFLETLL